MKIKNLRKNILYLLAFEWSGEKADEPFQTRRIYENFSDLPPGIIQHHLEAMSNEGLVNISSDQKCISITVKGLSGLRKILPPLA